jgi:hypothetical protein
MIATRANWNKIIPLPPEKETLKIELKYNLNEFEKIKNGFIPIEMEDKWFIFYENDILYFHRSWTGYCIYEVHFEKDTDFYKSVNAYVNRNKDQHKNTDGAYDKKLLISLIDQFLLKK